MAESPLPDNQRKRFVSPITQPRIHIHIFQHLCISSFPIETAEDDKRRADYIDKDREEVRKSIQEAPEAYKKTSAYLGILLNQPPTLKQHIWTQLGLYSYVKNV